MLPRVSVIIPTYNSAATIERAIASVAVQTYQNLKIHIVDDASNDDTVVRAKAGLEKAAQMRTGFAYDVIERTVNGGPSKARNAGVRAADSEYVAFLDSDDIWLPKKLEKQIARLEADRNVRLCGCQAEWVDENLTVQGTLYENLPDLLIDGWKTLLWNRFVVMSCAVVRRCDLGTSPFDESLKVGEGRDLWIRLASNGPVALEPGVLVQVTIPQESYLSQNAARIVSDSQRMIEGFLRDFSDSISFIERLRTRGKLHSDLGKILCSDPKLYWLGALYLVQAVLFHEQRLDCLKCLIRSLPILKKTRVFLARNSVPENS